MRYMMIVKANEQSEAGQPPDPRLMAAVAKHSEEMARAGKLLMSGGLAPSKMGTRVELGGGELKVVDGPFAETTELVGGFAIMECASHEEAVELGKRFMGIHREVMGPSYRGTLEIRQLFSPDDKPDCRP